MLLMEEAGFVTSECNSAFLMKKLEECHADLGSALCVSQCLIFLSAVLIKH